MSGILDQHTAARLERICGLLRSDHVGERAAAAAKASACLDAAGLTWAALVQAAAVGLVQRHVPRLPPHVATARWALALGTVLSQRERAFLLAVLRRKSLTPRQSAWLEVIADALRRGGAS